MTFAGHRLHTRRRRTPLQLYLRNRSKGHVAVWQRSAMAIGRYLLSGKSLILTTQQRNGSTRQPKVELANKTQNSKK